MTSLCVRRRTVAHYRLRSVAPAPTTGSRSKSARDLDEAQGPPTLQGDPRRAFRERRELGSEANVSPMIAHEIRPSVAALRLTSEGAFDALSRARELEALGHDVIHLEIGEPDFATPRHVKAAGIAAIERDDTHYAPSVGTAALRDAIAAYASRARGMTPYARENVVVSPGLKPMIWNVMTALLDPGDEVVFADPAYPAYHSCAAYLGARAVTVPLVESADFRLDLDRLAAAITPRTKLLMLNSPHNPTGGVLTPGDLETIATLALRNDVTVLSDEIYSRNLYDAEFVSIAALDGMRERTIVLDGFSKAFAMTGWRLGYALLPASIAKMVALLGQNTYSCVAPFVQAAGVEALAGPEDEIDAMVAAFRERRDAIVAGLNSLPGITCRTPAGAFYAFPNVSALTHDDRKLASFFLEEAHVAGLGGSCFGDAGRGYMRFSYAQSLEAIATAIDRMRAVLPRFVA